MPRRCPAAISLLLLLLSIILVRGSAGNGTRAATGYARALIFFGLQAGGVGGVGVEGLVSLLRVVGGVGVGGVVVGGFFVGGGLWVGVVGWGEVAGGGGGGGVGGGGGEIPLGDFGVEVYVEPGLGRC